MIKLYILPVQFAEPIYRGPKYFKWRFNPDGFNVPWSMRDYGGMGETTMILAADVLQSQHDFLAAQSDVFVIPDSLDVAPSPGELNAFTAHLETITIPSDWINPSDTWREALRTILGMFATAGKYAVLVGESILDSNITMNMQFSDYPQYVQDALATIALNRGYPWEEVKGNWTTRIVLKWFADQWPSDSFRFGNLIIV